MEKIIYDKIHEGEFVLPSYDDQSKIDLVSKKASSFIIENNSSFIPSVLGIEKCRAVSSIRELYGVEPYAIAVQLLKNIDFKNNGKQLKTHYRCLFV